MLTEFKQQLVVKKTKNKLLSRKNVSPVCQCQVLVFLSYTKTEVNDYFLSLLAIHIYMYVYMNYRYAFFPIFFGMFIYFLFIYKSSLYMYINHNIFLQCFDPPNLLDGYFSHFLFVKPIKLPPPSLIFLKDLIPHIIENLKQLEENFHTLLHMHLPTSTATFAAFFPATIDELSMPG